MRVAFPTNNQRTITSHIGLAKGFLIVDTKSGERFYIQNPVTEKISDMDLRGTEGQRGLGTGRIIPPLLKEAGVDLLVARDFGEGMVRNLEFEGIEALVTENREIDEVLKNIDSLSRVGVRNGFRQRFGRGYKRGLGFGRGFGRRRFRDF